jgi:FkbM family methyltransferase
MDNKLMKNYINKLNIRGIMHIGANTCQELNLYTNFFNIPDSQIVWIEAIPLIVNILNKRGIKNVFQVVLDEKPGKVEFLVTNNEGQSSSILELKTHLDIHPEIRVIQKLLLDSTTLEKFVSESILPKGCLDFIVMDIQGAELRVLRGSPNILKECKMLCTEILNDELYEGAGLFKDLNLFLEEHGFVCVKHVLNDKNYGDALYIRKDLL